MTLIEVLLAIALLGIVIVPLSKFFMDSFVYQNRNTRIVKANKVAEYIVETFKNGKRISS